jgi:hypothetical protein
MTNDHPEERSEQSSEISPAKLALAAFGSLVATYVLGQLGFAGTLVGAALAPVIIALSQELVRRPARRVRGARIAVVRGSPAVPRERRLSFRSRLRWRADVIPWRSVLITAGLAFAIVVGVFTVADLAVGRSVVADRPKTFFPSRSHKQQPTTGTTGVTTTAQTTETAATETVTTVATTVETTPTTGTIGTQPPPGATQRSTTETTPSP